MSIWILEYGMEYDGSHILGVYSSKKLAMDAFDIWRKEYFSPYGKLPKGDYYSIFEMKIDEPGKLDFLMRKSNG